MTPQSFLDLLWGDKPESLYILIWTLQDKRSHWCRDVGQAAAVVEACRAMDTTLALAFLQRTSALISGARLTRSLGFPRCGRTSISSPTRTQESPAVDAR